MLAGDIRSATRFLLRNPGFALAVVLALAIGVGANTLVVSWLDSLVLNPLPAVHDYSRVVAVNATDADGSSGAAPRISYLDFQAWREGQRSFAGLAGYGGTRLALRRGETDHAQAAWGLLVTGDYFALLGVRAALGRPLGLADEHAAAPVVAVSHAFWRRELGADSGVIGRVLLLNRVGVTIVGVMPADFTGHEVALTFDLYLPATLHQSLNGGPDVTRDRRVRWLSAVGRLKPGVSVAAARADLDGVARRTGAAGGDRPVTGATALPMREWRAGGVLFPILVTLLVVSVIVLLLCCVSVATLVLVRVLGRSQEFGVRMALGGGRWRVARLVLIEVVILALVGGAAGVALAFALKPLIAAFVPPTPQPVSLEPRLRLEVMALAMTVAGLSALAAGLGPALRGGTRDLAGALRAGGRGVIGSRGRLLEALVGIQMLFAVLSLTSAAFFLKGLDSARRVDVGFRDPQGVLLYGVNLNAARLTGAEAVAAMDRALENIAALPGVTGAGLATMVPLGFGGHRFAPAHVQGYTPGADEDLSVEVVSVAGNYFELMRIPVLAGRALGPRDRSDTEATLVVNAAFARRFLAGGDGLGRVVNVGSGPATVVGIVPDGRYDELNDPPKPLVYRPWSQEYRGSVTLHVRTAGAPRAAAQSVRDAIRSVHSDLVPTDLRTLSEHMEASTFVARLGASVLGVLGSLALAVAAVGLFGVVAFSVRQRSRELSIRVLLGASPWGVQALFVRRSAILAGTAALAGSAITAGLAPLAAGQLGGANVRDPSLYLGVIALVVMIAVVAAFVPARRAVSAGAAAALVRD